MAEIVVKLVNGELAGKTMQQINKDVNAAALALKKAEVGTKAWVDANKKLEDTKKVQGDLKKQIEGTTSASNILKDAWNKLPGAQFFNQISQSMGMAKTGVGGLVSSMGVLKTAIVATGIGALVLIITSLVAWFKKTDEGATKLDGIFRAIGQTVDVLMNRLINLGSSLRSLFSNPKQFFQGLFADIKEGIELGQELADTFDNLDQARRDMELADAQQQNNIDKLLLQSKNVGLSYKERLDALKAVDTIEQQNYQTKLKYSQDFLAAVNKETEFQQKQGTISDEQLDKQNEARIALLKVQNESIVLQEKIANRRALITEEQEAENNRIAAAEKKRRDDLDKDAEKRAKDNEAAIKNTEDLKLQLMDEGTAKQIAQIELDTQRKISALVGSEAQITEQTLLLVQDRETQIQAVKDKFAADQLVKDQKALAEANELALATSQNALSEQLLSRQITEQEFADLSAQNALQFQKQKLDLIRAAHGEESAEYQRANAEYLQMQQAASDQAVAIKEMEIKDQLAAMQGALGTFGNFFNTLAGMQQQGTAQWKAFATTAAILSTIQGAVNAYTSTAAIPIVGSVLAPIAAGLALAAGYANVRRIQNTQVQPPTKKAKGGVLRGPSHAQGGIPIEAEGDEIVLTKGVYRNRRLRQMASELNAAGGGIRFEAGGPVNPFPDRNPIARGATNAVASPSVQEKPAWVDELIAAQDRRIDRIKVINVVSETDDGIKTLNDV